MFGNQVNVYGVKRNEARTLILEIMDSRAKIAKILDTIELDFYNSKNYYKTLDGALMAKCMDEISVSFKDILSKIDGYVETLEKVMITYEKSSADVSNIFVNKVQKDVNDTIPTIKEINVVNIGNKWGNN